MARAAVIPGVSATDVPQARATRGRGRTPTTSATDAQEVKKSEPAKRGRKPGKTTTAATTAAAKNKKSVVDADRDLEDEEDDDLSFDVSSNTTAAKTAKKTTKNATSTKKGPVKVVVEDNASSEEDDDDELADFEVTKKKAGRPAKSKATPVATAPATKSTRGRPKTVKSTDQQELDGATEKKTRGRRPATKQTTDNDKTIYVATGSTMSSLAKARILGDPAKKKKVTFADLTDSDNEASEMEEQKPVAKSTAKKATAGTKSSGLKAKPVRKVGTATRGRPPKSQTAAAVKPLSPKKATQLAKGSSSSASSGDEDELAHEKTVYSLVVQKSPVKTQEPQHTGLSSPVKRIMLPGQVSTPARPPSRGTIPQDENSIPSLPNPSSTLRDSMFMGSPARRPPPSTSKETIRDTPRRGPLFISHPSASKLSATEANPFMQNVSPLKASPKKGGNLASFMSASPEKGSSTPFNAKSSLLKSPAKRIQSPFVFQKLHESKLSRPDSGTNDDVDTKMRDDDVFLDEKADDLSDDELSMGLKAAQERHKDDVSVYHPVAQEQSEDENEQTTDVEEEVDAVDVVQDQAELVQDAESVNVHEDIEHQQQEVAEEDVEMSQDEPDVNDENRDPKGFEDHEIVQTSELDDNAESDAEMEEDVPEEDVPEEEHASSEVATENVDNVQSTIEETAQQLPATEEQDTIENHIKEPAESDTADPNEVVLQAEPEDEHNDTLPEIDTPHWLAALQSARSSIDARDVIHADEVDEELSQSTQGTPRFIPPAAPSPPIISSMCEFPMSFRDYRDDMSEYGASPASRRQSVFSNRNSILPHSGDAADDTFTSLAARLDSWKASSPAKQRRKSPQRSIFSPVVPKNLATPSRSMQGNKYNQIQSMRQSLAARHSLANSVVMDGDEMDTVARQSPKKQTSEVVTGGEEQAQAETKTVQPEDKVPRLPMSITPVRVNRDAIRTVHTVSKVPLKPEADESPIKYPRKRARSMSIDIKLPIRASPGRVKLVPKSRKSTTPDSPVPTPTKRSPLAEIKDTVESEHAVSSTTASPAKTPRRNLKADQQCLRGAVVFVDVHTTEGEDASGIFVELLTQMGAKCVKSWSWNPRSSQSPGVDGTESLNSKVGITHIVYKDGGVRTMEKVRQAGDLVKCVGVGWVLEYGSSALLYIDVI